VPAGDGAQMLELTDRADEAASAIVARVAERVRAAELAGVTDVVPGIVTVTVQFDASDAAQAAERRRAVTEALQAALADAGSGDQAPTRPPVEIPVCYEPAYGPDLAEVAAVTGLSVEQVVRRHVGSAHRVLIMGFAPGFGYVGGLDPALGVPRRATPRARVEAGSVAIANGQTAIYPFASPGGWNLIGRTPLRMFDAAREPPSLLQAGDRIVFVPITGRVFERMAAEQAAR
jgi:KipI family sensor histidine kinase inhibitor